MPTRRQWSPCCTEDQRKMLWMRAHHEAASLRVPSHYTGGGAGARSAAISWLQLPCSSPCWEMALKGPAFTCQILPADARWKPCASLQAGLVPVGSYEMLTVNAISATAQMLAPCVIGVRLSVFLICQLGLASLTHVAFLQTVNFLSLWLLYHQLLAIIRDS